MEYRRLSGNPVQMGSEGDPQDNVREQKTRPDQNQLKISRRLILSKIMKWIECCIHLNVFQRDLGWRLTNCSLKSKSNLRHVFFFFPILKRLEKKQRERGEKKKKGWTKKCSKLYVNQKAWNIYCLSLL